MRIGLQIVSLLAIAGGAVCAAQNANLSGNWHLDTDKSHWGSKPKPVSVVLMIDHKDPALEYHGTVTQTSENTRDFSFRGAIDGKEYPLVSSVGAGVVVFRRVDANTIESDFKGTDGNRSESTRTSLSRDGSVLTRTIREKTPEGTKSWTEVYHRQ